MNEQKSLTLEEAQTEIQSLKAEASFVSAEEAQGYRVAMGRVSDILNRVHVPELDEEGQAVLWLMKEKKKPICITDYGWEWQLFEDEDEWYPFNPIEEAKKLGWGGGE